MVFSFIFNFLISISFAQGPSALQQAIANTQNPDVQINLLEERKANLKGHNLEDVAARTQLQRNIDQLKRDKARRLLQQSIESTDVPSMLANQPAQESSRLAPRKQSTGSTVLDSVVDNTVKESNPAVRGQSTPEGRALVLYRDVDPADLFNAKEIGKKENVVVYKSTDLRGRPVYKTLDGNVSNAIVQNKAFPHEDIIYRDVQANLKKGQPRAIYPDGTLEIRETNGATTRRSAGSYHTSSTFEKAEGRKVKTRSGQTLYPYAAMDDDANLNAKEKKALESLRKAMCDM